MEYGKESVKGNFKKEINVEKCDEGERERSRKEEVKTDEFNKI